MQGFEDRFTSRGALQRLGRWEQTGDPADLWPGLERADFLMARDDIARVTRHLLEHRDRGGALEAGFTASPRAVGVAAFSAVMGPLLGYWVESGRLLVSPELARILADHLAHGRDRATMLDAALGRVLDAFQSRGVPAALLKGMHTAWAYFPEPGTRPCSDIDLLIRPTDLVAAVQALRSLGFHPGALKADGLRGEWLSQTSGRDPVSLELTHRDAPWAVDLHSTLDRTYRLGVPCRVGPHRPQDGPVLQRGGRMFYVLPQPLMLAWLAIHTSNHLEVSPLLRYLELVLVIRKDFGSRPELWEDLLRLARERKVERFLYPSLDLAERLAPGSVPAEVRLRLRRASPWLMRRVVPRLRPEQAQQVHRLSLDVRIMWLGSPRDLWRALIRGLQPSSGGPRPGWRGVKRRVARWIHLLKSGGLSLRSPDR